MENWNNIVMIRYRSKQRAIRQSRRPQLQRQLAQDREGIQNAQIYFKPQ